MPPTGSLLVRWQRSRKAIGHWLCRATLSASPSGLPCPVRTPRRHSGRAEGDRRAVWPCLLLSVREHFPQHLGYRKTKTRSYGPELQGRQINQDTDLSSLAENRRDLSPEAGYSPTHNSSSLSNNDNNDKVGPGTGWGDSRADHTSSHCSHRTLPHDHLRHTGTN